MAQMIKHPASETQVLPAPPAAPDRAPCPPLPLEDLPTRRYVNPIPKPGEGAAFRPVFSARDSAAILAALEQQNNLLAELLASVTGLTAACLCRKTSPQSGEA